MISKFAYKNLTWVDLEKPTKEEVAHLMENYTVPPLVGEELLQPTMLSKADLHDREDVIYLVLHFPVLNAQTKNFEDREIDFVLGKDFIITTHYENIDPLHQFSKVFEVNSILDRGNIGDHAGFLFLYMIKELYKHSTNELEGVHRELKQIEENVFSEKESKMVEQISNANRKLLNFGRAIRFHGSVLKSFKQTSLEVYGQKFVRHMPGIISEYEKIQNTIDANKDFLNNLRETNDSLLSSRVNERMSMLTILTFVMLPITFITGFFGMNTSIELVVIDTAQDLALIVLGMVILGLIMFIYFKKKKWI